MTTDFQPFIILVDQILSAKQNPHVSVIPEEAGIQSIQKNMDSRFHGNEEKSRKKGTGTLSEVSEGAEED